MAVSLATLFTSDLLTTLRGDPLEMKQAMELVGSCSPTQLGIGTLPWLDYPSGVNAIIITKTDVESALGLTWLDIEDHLVAFRLCNISTFFLKTSCEVDRCDVGASSSMPGCIPLPDSLKDVPPAIVIHLLKMLLGLGLPKVSAQTVCLRDVHKNGRAFPKTGTRKFDKAFFSQQEGVLRFLSLICALVSFMNDFAANWEPNDCAVADVLVQSPVAKASVVYEDPTRWYATVTWLFPPTDESSVASQRLSMLTDLMASPVFFGSDTIMVEMCFAELLKIRGGMGLPPAAVGTISQYRGDVDLPARLKRCKCGGRLPEIVMAAHATILCEKGEEVAVNHDDLAPIQKKSKKNKTAAKAPAGTTRKQQDTSDSDSDSDDNDSDNDDDNDDDNDHGRSEEDEEEEDEKEAWEQKL